MFDIVSFVPSYRKERGLPIIFPCPSSDWLSRAAEVTSFVGVRFTVAFPEKYKDDHFPHGARVGASFRVWADAIGADYDFQSLCRATLESFERIRVKDLRSKYLKGVFGLQYVGQLMAWFNGPEYLDKMDTDESSPELLGDNDFVCLAEFKVTGPAE